MARKRPENPKPGEDARKREPAHTFAAGHVPESSEGAAHPSVPRQYGMDMVRATARGPRSLFVYWELTGATSARLRERLGPGLNWILRLCNVGAAWQADIPVDPDAGNYYVKVKPAGRYTVEMGIGVGGTFRPVCQSEECVIPGEQPQAAGEPVWADLRAPGARACNMPGRIPRDADRVPGLVWRPYWLGASSFSSAGRGRRAKSGRRQ